MNPGPQASIAESSNESGSLHGSSEFSVGPVCPSKRASNCVAGCWVTFGKVRIRLKVVRSAYGLFVIGPSVGYNARNGRRRYVHHTWIAPDLFERVAAAVLAGYEARLARDRRSVPRFIDRHAGDDLDDDFDDDFDNDLDGDLDDN